MPSPRLLTTFPYFQDGENSDDLDLIREQFPRLLKSDLDRAMYNWLCVPGNYKPPHTARATQSAPVCMNSIEQILADVLRTRDNPRADHMWFEFMASLRREPRPAPPAAPAASALAATPSRIGRGSDVEITRSRDASRKGDAAMIATVQATGKIAQVAKAFGVSRRHLTRRMRAAGIGPANPEASERMKKMCADQASSLTVGRLRAALESTTDAQQRAFIYKKAAVKTQQALLKVLRKENALLKKTTQPQRDSDQQLSVPRAPDRAPAG